MRRRAAGGRRRIDVEEVVNDVGSVGQFAGDSRKPNRRPRKPET